MYSLNIANIMSVNSVNLATPLMDFELEIFFDLGPYLISFETEERKAATKKMILLVLFALTYVK